MLSVAQTQAAALRPGIAGTIVVSRIAGAHGLELGVRLLQRPLEALEDRAPDEPAAAAISLCQQRADAARQHAFCCSAQYAADAGIILRVKDTLRHHVPLDPGPRRTATDGLDITAVYAAPRGADAAMDALANAPSWFWPWSVAALARTIAGTDGGGLLGVDQATADREAGHVGVVAQVKLLEDSAPVGLDGAQTQA